MANGGTRGRAPELSRAQAARMGAWWQWKREQDRLIREAFAAFTAGDVDRFAELTRERESTPEPDQFNG